MWCFSSLINHYERRQALHALNRERVRRSRSAMKWERTKWQERGQQAFDSDSYVTGSKHPNPTSRMHSLTLTLGDQGKMSLTASMQQQLHEMDIAAITLVRLTFSACNNVTLCDRSNLLRSSESGRLTALKRRPIFPVRDGIRVDNVSSKRSSAKSLSFKMTLRH